MNISRDTRIDRRRRVLRDASLNESGQDQGDRSDLRTRRTRSRTPDIDSDGVSQGKRSAGYSQDVRRACATRLVQFIPVRPFSFLAVVGFSSLLTGLLLMVHYWIYVNGKLDWYGHPLAVSFDATHPQSIAAWLGSHLWLMCLVTTILTFQLRRHKLDDYTGEYRLWFWLVLTCILAGMDSTTHLSELLGYSIDRWTQLNMGWSGKAVVQSTMAVLVGVLGIRLCSELKSVPVSLLCWLLGLSMWAGGAALAQEKFRIDISLQMRYWLRAAFWLGGLTLIWIASLAYLRHVYIEAQRRFLLRNKMIGRSARPPVTKRLRESMAINPLSLMGFRKNKAAVEESSSSTNRRPAKTASEITTTPATANSRAPTSSTTSTSTTATNFSRGTASAPLAPNATRIIAETTKGNSAASIEPTEKSNHRWGFRLWSSKSTRADEAPEYCKVVRSNEEGGKAGGKVEQPKLPQQNAEKAREQRARDRQSQEIEKAAASEARRNEKESKLKERQAQREAARQAKQERKHSGQGWKWSRLIPLAAVGSLLGKIRMPSLSGLKLAPPEPDQPPSASPSSPVQAPRPIANDRPLPGTVRINQRQDDGEDEDRYLSKAERKRRRQGRAA